MAAGTFSGGRSRSGLDAGVISAEVKAQLEATCAGAVGGRGAESPQLIGVAMRACGGVNSGVFPDNVYGIIVVKGKGGSFGQ